MIYFLCAFLIQETRHRFQDAVISLDQIGSFIFILVEVVFFIILYFVFLKSHSYKLTTVLFFVLFILNFILVGVMIALLSKDVEDVEISGSGLGERDLGIRRSLDEYIWNPRLYTMLFASLCLVRVTSVFLFRFDVLLKEEDDGDTNLYSYYRTIILTQTLSAIIVGLLSYFTRTSVNEYIWAIIGAIIAIIGVILYLVSKDSSNITYAGTILVAIGSGIGWVMFPLIAYDDAGPQPFGVILSLIFLFNFWGMTFFGGIFFLLTEYSKPLMPFFFVFIVGLIASIISSAISLFLDDEQIKRYY